MSAWAKFRQWRRSRPFWGGLFLLLSALELYFSGNLSLKNIEIHIGQQGFLIYLLPVIMLLCGLLVWFTPAQRLFYGIIGLLTALYSFLGLNLGGFFLGMLLGILGGALVIAWGPPRAPRVDPADTAAEFPAAARRDEREPRPSAPAPDPAAEPRPYATGPDPAVEPRPYATAPDAVEPRPYGTPADTTQVRPYA